MNERVENEVLRVIIILVISLGAAAPFMWALMAKRPNNQAYKELWIDKKYNRGPLLIVEISRNILGVMLIGLWVDRLVSTQVALLVAIPVIVLVLFLFSKRIQKFYQRIESRFITNLNARETAAANGGSPKTEILRRNANFQSSLAPWDAHIIEMEVNPSADYIGKTLLELAWRERYGVNIVYIKRGEQLINIPGRRARLLPFDQVGIIATDDQMQLFKPVFDATESIRGENLDISDISLEKILVNEHTRLKGHTIRDSGLRERTNGVVVGIQRESGRILNPDSSTVFEWGDIVWIVGERKKILQIGQKDRPA
ncbi:MAG TPA: TrkA C-terminal domain-containing protein [Agriterribacter sp.]|nr:TrkA C-terminal domain-containing protein [Agriterribacter sp.]